MEVAAKEESRVEQMVAEEAKVAGL